MMEAQATARAVEALLAARRQGQRLERLPDGTQPATIDEAHAVQDAVVLALNERVVGWKVAITPAGVTRGAILERVVQPSPAHMPGADQPLLGVEAEIAFVFEHGLPPRDAEYGAAEVAAAAVAVVGLEVVGTRFRDYDQAPALDRLSDCMSNGGFVVGTRCDDWQDHDLAALEATLLVNGAPVVRQVGGHVTKHPLAPAVALANVLRRGSGVAPGQFITTGTFTGLHRAAPGDAVEAVFTGFGTAAITFDR